VELGIVEPSSFIWFKNKTGSILGKLPEIPLMWGSQTTFQECNVASVIWDEVDLKVFKLFKIHERRGKKLNFDDFVEKNTGIQTYIYKILNFLFKIDPPCFLIHNFRDVDYDFKSIF
jgi:hypothetical protein